MLMTMLTLSGNGPGAASEKPDDTPMIDGRSEPEQAPPTSGYGRFSKVEQCNGTVLASVSLKRKWSLTQRPMPIAPVWRQHSTLRCGTWPSTAATC